MPGDAFGVEAVSEETLATVRTATARTHARQDHLVADGQLRDARADLGDDADAFVSEDSTDFDLRDVALQDVQVGAADSGGDHLDDDVRRLLDHWIRYLFPALLAGTFVDECFHGWNSLCSVVRHENRGHVSTVRTHCSARQGQTSLFDWRTETFRIGPASSMKCDLRP